MASETRQNPASKIKMALLEDFRDNLKETLLHLYDPDFSPGEEIYAVLGWDLEVSSGVVQSDIIHTIEVLIDEAEKHSGSRTSQSLEVLYHRYVLQLTQGETANRLHMSLRSIQRLQGEAIHLLARHLWESRGEDRLLKSSEILKARSESISQDEKEWLLQLRQELFSLQRSDPEAESNLRETIDGALKIAQTAAIRKDIVMDASQIQADIQVKLHPSILRQVLLAIITELKQAMSTSGRITLTTREKFEKVQLVITACPAATNKPIEIPLAQELLTIQSGALSSDCAGGEINVTVDLPINPPKRKKIVLAIEDNADLIALYQSYCLGTDFKIIHAQEGKQVFPIIEETLPDIILLDVMLPDIDGWDLLLDFHANPKTKDIPVILCSVITDEKLALNLGASMYLRKPVWRDHLIEAFNEVLRQSSTSG